MEPPAVSIPLKCELCSKTFKYNKALNVHIQKFHPPPSKDPNNFVVVEPVCKFCGKRFQRLSSFEKHVRRAHFEVNVPSNTKGINFTCDTCGFSCSHRRTLIQHIQDKHPEEICSDISRQAFECPSCSEKFEFYANLEQHVKRIHPNYLFQKCINKFFTCNICNLDFSHRYDLRRHKWKEHSPGVKKITNTKRYLCSFCSKRFNRRLNLHFHLFKKHPNKWNSLEESELLSFNSVCCAHCGKWYYDKTNLIKHIRREHLSVIKPASRKTKSSILPPVESNKNTNRGHRSCPLCSVTCTKKDAIYEHFRTQHDKRVETNAIVVADEADFNEWKVQFENETKSKFVKYNNYKSKKELVKKFICHRSGCFQSRSRGFRQPRLTGSEKINGFCPAEVRFVRQLDTDVCTVYYVNEHVGHGQELQFLKLEEPSKTPKHDLDMAADSEPSAEEKHLLDTILLSSWISEHADSVLYMKGPDDVDPDFPGLRAGADGDFVFIVMDAFQASMFAEYASDVVAVGRMEGPDDYELELFVVTVVDNYRLGIPCCVMLSNRSDRYVYELLFAKLGERAGRRRPRVFMSDTRDCVADAWAATMPAAERQLYCSWHVQLCWEKNLKRIGCAQKRKRIRRWLYAMRNELNPLRFDGLLRRLLRTEDPEVAPFLAYFRRHFAKEAAWAYCYRKHAGINANTVCDQFFRRFRRRLRGRACVSLERVLEGLASLLESLPREKLIREVKGKLVSKIREARLRHSAVAGWPPDHLNAINHVSENKWLVPSAEEMYEVERVLTRCHCKLTCRECRSCLHQYRCSCLDNCIQFNMCVHIHAVCMLQNLTEGVDENYLMEVLEVDVVENDQFVDEIDDVAVYSECDQDPLLLPIEGE